MNVAQAQPVIYTNEARCRDCYRCVRVCPVKAIRVEHSQAQVDAGRCLQCGTCVRECPQGAKSYRRDQNRAEALLAERKFVGVSLAPAFAGVFEPWELQRLPAALRRLGFGYVAETAVGAHWVAEATAALMREDGPTQLCTACPAAVSYVEKYRPTLLPSLLPLVSPMLAHARHLKALHGPEAGFVFVGPCIAKKAEAERPEHQGLVDCVLTFEELGDWLQSSGIDLGLCEESGFDELPGGGARLFPVEGGSLAAAGLAAGAAQERFLQLSGFEALRQGFAAAEGGAGPRLVEPLLCAQGCVNGPGLRKGGNAFERRAKVVRYARSRPPAEGAATAVSLATAFQGRVAARRAAVTEDQVRAVLEQTGRGRPENQLNCGACGYASCRDQAEAVLQGMAEREMCIPYMRRLAEQRSNRIMETSPNGIVVLDRGLVIRDANASFERLFHATGVSGQAISQYVDPEPFERLATGQAELFDGPSNALGGQRARLIAYALPQEERFVGIFVGLAAPGDDAQRLERFKAETVEQARELHQQQIGMAKQLAVYLGEHTARGEALVHKLIEAVGADAAELP